MISYSTTEIAISRATAGDESWETTLTEVAAGIRAHIDPMLGVGSSNAGATGTTLDQNLTLFADPCDLHAGDIVTDSSDRVFTVENVFSQKGPLEHVLAHLSVRLLD